MQIIRLPGLYNVYFYILFDSFFVGFFSCVGTVPVHLYIGTGEKNSNGFLARREVNSLRFSHFQWWGIDDDTAKCCQRIPLRSWIVTFYVCFGYLAFMFSRGVICVFLSSPVRSSMFPVRPCLFSCEV